VAVRSDHLPGRRPHGLKPVVVAERGAYVLGATARVGVAGTRADGPRRALPA
jgi:hypothetical protein